MDRDYALVLRPEEDRLDLVAYWGAKKYDRLAAMKDYGLEGTVNLGWFGLLAKPILAGLLWLHDNLVHNYGWAIVLMTVAIKLLLFPLTHKSYVSMQKMQQLNPRMQAIRAKWRGKLRDKQGKMNFEAQRQMNDEIRQLYAEEGVNPAGGCLPMILQLPILFAFYQLLSTAVELRGAPWLGWIHDLSAPDPYYALPLIMGATQFIQQRMTPMAGDPMQRRIMQFMPLIWLVFFLGFPAGLVLYWLTNNVLTIAQQGIYQSYKKRRARAAGGESPDPKAEARTPKTKRAKRVPKK
jgi:YidC/Oxa1 family membrane protein insertase